MKTILISIFLLSFSIFSQEGVPQTKTNTSSPSEKKTGASTDTGDTTLQDTAKTETTIFEDLELDKEFYVYYNYLNTQPKSDSREENKILNTNLLKTFKGEIKLRDPENYRVIQEDINVATVKVKNVSKDSIWMKKIRKEVGYIQFTDFMYIIKYKNYLALILYEVDPKKHLITPNQLELIINREPPPAKDEY
ncbi:MAG: hypothetical protein KDK36_09280 [Leptospiraceae bacterium]|nr:hypothetical protein [Leptospiraceae bacterium]